MKTAKRVKLLPGEVTEIPLKQEGSQTLEESEYVFEPDETTMDYFRIETYVQNVGITNEMGIMIARNGGAKIMEIPSGIIMGKAYRILETIPIRRKDEKKVLSYMNQRRDFRH